MTKSQRFPHRGIKAGRLHITTVRALSGRAPHLDRCWTNGETNHRFLVWGKGRQFAATGYAIRLRRAPSTALVIAWETKGLLYRLGNRVATGVRTRRLRLYAAQRAANPSSGNDQISVGRG